MGEFMVDMHSINTLDLNEEQGKNYLNIHLKSEDFFLSKLFPETIYRFYNIQSVVTPYQTDTNYIFDGELTIKGISRKQKINVLISKIDNILILNARVEIDRTKWGIIYGSTKFFKFLGMHKVFDAISIDMRLELVS